MFSIMAFIKVRTLLNSVVWDPFLCCEVPWSWTLFFKFREIFVGYICKENEENNFWSSFDSDLKILVESKVRHIDLEDDPRLEVPNILNVAFWFLSRWSYHTAMGFLVQNRSQRVGKSAWKESFHFFRAKPIFLVKSAPSNPKVRRGCVWKNGWCACSPHQQPSLAHPNKQCFRTSSYEPPDNKELKCLAFQELSQSHRWLMTLTW